MAWRAGVLKDRLVVSSERAAAANARGPPGVSSMANSAGGAVDGSDDITWDTSADETDETALERSDASLVRAACKLAAGGATPPPSAKRDPVCDGAPACAAFASLLLAASRLPNSLSRAAPREVRCGCGGRCTEALERSEPPPAACKLLAAADSRRCRGGSRGLLGGRRSAAAGAASSCGEKVQARRFSRRARQRPLT